MRKVLSIHIISIFLLLGCETLQMDIITQETVSNPSHNKEIVASIGDILLEQKTRYVTEGFEIFKDLPSGEAKQGLYSRIGIQQGYIIYKPVESSGAQIINTYKTLIGINALVFFASNQNKQLFYSWYGGFGNIVPAKQIPDTLFKYKDVAVDQVDSIQQTLIYTGKQKNIIKISYRESQGGMARTAFNMEATYDLDESNVIAFKNARLLILKATNTSIKYSVLKNFND